MATLSPNLSVPQWLTLSNEVRSKIREIFNISKSKGTHLVGNILESDGCTHEDLKAITIEKMQEYLKVPDTDFFDLFNRVVDSVKIGLIPIEEPKKTVSELTMEQWISILIQMKTEAESLGLKTEFIKLLKKKQWAS